MAEIIKHHGSKASYWIRSQGNSYRAYKKLANGVFIKVNATDAARDCGMVFLRFYADPGKSNKSMNTVAWWRPIFKSVTPIAWTDDVDDVIAALSSLSQDMAKFFWKEYLKKFVLIPKPDLDEQEELELEEATKIIENMEAKAKEEGEEIEEDGEEIEEENENEISHELIKAVTIAVIKAIKQTKP